MSQYISYVQHTDRSVLLRVSLHSCYCYFFFFIVIFYFASFWLGTRNGYIISVPYYVPIRISVYSSISSSVAIKSKICFPQLSTHTPAVLYLVKTLTVLVSAVVPQPNDQTTPCSPPLSFVSNAMINATRSLALQLYPIHFLLRSQSPTIQRIRLLRPLPLTIYSTERSLIAVRHQALPHSVPYCLVSPHQTALAIDTL